MRPARAICGLVAAFGLFGQPQERPRFSRDHVIPHGWRQPRALARGQFVSIHGWNLVPRPWCAESHERQEPFPTEICGVRVLVGGRPAGLLYAGPIGNKVLHADQINFQVPADAPSAGMAPLQVCVATLCSDPLEVEFTAKDILLRVVGEARVHMPLWIEVDIPMNPRIRYPRGASPWDFGGYAFEVRQKGRLLAQSPMPDCPNKHPDRLPAYGTLAKIPLHLAYRFDRPGTYEVRVTGPVLSADLEKVARTGQSDWLEFRVLPSTDRERAAWLLDVEKKANGSLGWMEAVLSLLAWPDEAALAKLMPFLPQPPLVTRRVVRVRNSNWARNCLAQNALRAFPEPVLRKLIPAERLRDQLATAMSCR